MWGRCWGLWGVVLALASRRRPPASSRGLAGAWAGACRRAGVGLGVVGPLGCGTEGRAWGGRAVLAVPTVWRSSWLNGVQGRRERQSSWLRAAGQVLENRTLDGLADCRVGSRQGSLRTRSYRWTLSDGPCSIRLERLQHGGCVKVLYVCAWV